MNNNTAEIVNSLAKWKRMALAEYKIAKGYGLYTDMNAVRPDEELDNIHSLYVDQWDWERVISADDRNLETLKRVVSKIYEAIKRTEYVVCEYYNCIHPVLPENITFVHTEELQALYPSMTPKEREWQEVKKHGAIFVIGIGGQLADGKPHDGRGDIILWNPVLESAYEISSMGIRVDKKCLLEQLKISGAEDRKELMFHKRLLNDELPQSIGGGIGQSRLCMYYLRKAHIGEIQSSIWPEDMVTECKKNNIILV